MQTNHTPAASVAPAPHVRRTFTIYLTDAERALLKRVATRDHLSLSAWLRRVALRAADQERIG